MTAPESRPPISIPPTCCIQWIDEAGHPTPDTNPAIGRVKLRSHQITLPDGRLYRVEESDWFPICQTHATRLQDPDMCHWIFELFPTNA